MAFRVLIQALSSLLALFLVLQCQPAHAQNARRLVEEGIQLDEQGRSADALQRFEQARAKAPELTRILLLLARQHLKLGHPESALPLLETFQQQQPSPDVEEQELLRDCYGRSTTSLEQLAAQSPQRPELILLAGRAAFRSRNLDLARTLYQRYTQAVSQPPEALRAQRDVYVRELFEELVRQLPGRIQQQPTEVTLWLLLAESHLALAQDEAALDALDHYREAVPGPGGAEAAKLSDGYRTLLARWANPTDAQMLLRGRAAFGLGQHAQAGEDYARYRQATPSPSAPYAERQTRYERELQDTLAQMKALAAQQEAEAQARQARQQALAAQQAAEARRRAAEQRARASRWMIWTGAAGMVAGAGLLALGITAIAYDGRCINDAMPCDQQYDSLNLGIGTTVAGGALFVGGGSLLGIGLVRSKRAP